MSKVPLPNRRILAALDGSEHSKKAAEMAIDHAKRWEAELCLIHVMDTPRVPETFEKFARTESLSSDAYFGMACDSFVGEVQSKAKKAGVKKVELICVSGDPADEILKAAEDHKVDMIFMGSRGLGRFSRIIMGSVSTKVNQYARCTVVTAR